MAVFLQSYLMDGPDYLVIGIKDGSNQPHTPLHIAKIAASTDNQLWNLEPAVGAYYTIQSQLMDGSSTLVIGIKDASNTPGTALHSAILQYPDYTDNQLWTLVLAPSEVGSFGAQPYYFIQNKLMHGKDNLVIDLPSNTPHTTVVSSTQKSSGYDSQLWVLLPESLGP